MRGGAAIIAFGIDIARSGEDKSVLAVRYDYRVLPLEVWGKTDLMESVGRILPFIERHKPERIVIDADGIGAGVFDRLREMEYPVVAFHAAARCDRRDATGEIRFRNMRSYAWWRMREILDPANGFNVALPKDDDLIGELCTPRYTLTSSGLLIEAKADVKKRLKGGRSTDRADALIMSFWDMDSSFEEAYSLYTREDVEAMGQEDAEEEEPVPERVLMDRRLFGGAERSE